jgi:ribosomal protein S18 acetylase RimI-like enzyme
MLGSVSPAALIPALGLLAATPAFAYTGFMSITTRNATLNDIPTLVDLMQEFYAGSNYPLDRDWASASFSALLQDDSLGAAWLAFDDSELAGYVVLTVKFGMEYGGLDAFIDDLFIRSSYRRRGLGRELLKALIDECKRRKVQAVHVEAGHDNVAAKGLYHSYGPKPYNDGRQMLTVRLDDGYGDA